MSTEHDPRMASVHAALADAAAWKRINAAPDDDLTAELDRLSKIEQAASPAAGDKE